MAVRDSRNMLNCLLNVGKWHLLCSSMVINRLYISAARKVYNMKVVAVICCSCIIHVKWYVFEHIMAQPQVMVKETAWRQSKPPCNWRSASSDRVNQCVLAFRTAWSSRPIAKSVLDFSALRESVHCSASWCLSGIDA